MNSLSFRRKRNSTSEQQQKEYADWANEWLCRRPEPLRVNSLRTDLRNGVTLAAIIELVGGVKLYGIDTNPTTRTQQDENINASLQFLAQRGLQPDLFLGTVGIAEGDLYSTMSVMYHISKLDPRSKLKPVKHTRPNNIKLERQSSDGCNYSGYNANTANKSATIGPCMARSLPVLNRSYDSLSGEALLLRKSSDVRGSGELLSPTRKRPTSFDLSPNTPVIMEHVVSEFEEDDGIIQIGQKQHTGSSNSIEMLNQRRLVQSFNSTRRNTPPMDNVMMKMNGTKPVVADRNHHNKPQYNPQHQQQQNVNSQQSHQLNQQQNQQHFQQQQHNAQHNQQQQFNAQYQVPIPQQYQHPHSAQNANAQNQYYNTNSLTPDEKMSNLPQNIDNQRKAEYNQPQIKHCGSADRLSNPDNNRPDTHNSMTSLQWDMAGIKNNQLSNSLCSMDDKGSGSYETTLNQIKWLKRELELSKGKEEALQEQLTTNVHMVSAFQQSIDSLSSRLEQSNVENERKNKEMEKMKIVLMETNPQDAASPVKSQTLNHSSSMNSFSDMSDCETDAGPGAFDRTKKKRRSWRGSLTRAFSRKKKGWEDEWDTPQKGHREPFLSPEELGGSFSSVDNIVEAKDKQQLPKQGLPNGHHAVCSNCQMHQAKVGALQSELSEARAKNRPRKESLLNFVKDDSTNQAALYRIELTLACGADSFVIGSVGICDGTRWSDLDHLVMTCLANHLHTIDPAKQLGLRPSSLARYLIDSVERTPGTAELPQDIRNLRGGISISLRCGYTNHCDSTAYITLLPVSFIKIAVSTLQSKHFLCLVGPKHTGKTYTAEHLGRNLLEQLRPDQPEVAQHNVIIYEPEDLLHTDAVARFHKRLSSSSQPVVAVVNNYVDSSIRSETLKSLKESAGFKNSFIILITDDSQEQPIKDIKIVRCSCQCEPYSSLLERHYNRALALVTSENKARMQQILYWLVNVWRHVNDTLKMHVDGQCLIGPVPFFNVPLEDEGSEEWFSALWNLTLTPYIISTVKKGLEDYGRKHSSWVDPIEFIKGSYPWTTSKDYCDILQGVHATELNFDSYRMGPLVGGASVLSQDQIEEVLACLKEHLQTPLSTAPTTPRDCSRESNSNPVAPTRTTSVLSSVSSGSDDGLISIKSDHEPRQPNSSDTDNCAKTTITRINSNQQIPQQGPPSNLTNSKSYSPPRTYPNTFSPAMPNNFPAPIDVNGHGNGPMSPGRVQQMSPSSRGPQMSPSRGQQMSPRRPSQPNGVFPDQFQNGQENGQFQRVNSVRRGDERMNQMRDDRQKHSTVNGDPRATNGDPRAMNGGPRNGDPRGEDYYYMYYNRQNQARNGQNGVPPPPLPQREQYNKLGKV